MEGSDAGGEERLRRSVVVQSPLQSLNTISQRTSPIPLTDQSPPSIVSTLSESVHGSVLESDVGHHSPSITALDDLPLPGLRGFNGAYPIHAQTVRTGGETTKVPGTVPLPRAAPTVPFNSPADAWVNCTNALREYDEHMVRGWKEEIDSLLVFAGLFSAVLTAFNVESYKLLLEDPEETAVSLFKTVIAQLAVMNGSPPINFTVPPTQFTPDNRAVRINILWFSSLVFSLVSASIGILTKQWLREYISNAASSPRESARIRQFRHEGFVNWHVPETIALLPILLQISLTLFFGGLLDLLWSLHAAVAGVVTVIVTLALAFMALTTILPSIRGDCPYKSPQAMSVYRLSQGAMRMLSWLATRVYGYLGWHQRPWPLNIQPNLFFHRHRKVAGWLRSLIHRKYFQSWAQREKQIVRNAESSLDHRMLASADATFMDDHFLDGVVRLCINDADSPAAVRCLQDILAHRADGVVDGKLHWIHDAAVNTGMVSMADRLSRAIPFEAGHPDTVLLYERLFDNLARFLALGEAIQKPAFDLMQRLFPRSRAVVRPAVIHNIVSYARSAKISDRRDVFHRACELVLGFSVDPNLPAATFASIRTELHTLLIDIDAFFATSSPESRSLSLLLHLLELARKDASLVSEELLGVLDKLNAGAPSSPAVSFGGSDGSDGSWLRLRTLASGPELWKLRRRLAEAAGRPRWQRPVPRRQPAIMTDNLGDLGLRLPPSPRTPPSPHPSPVSPTYSPTSPARSPSYSDRVAAPTYSSAEPSSPVAAPTAAFGRSISDVV